jgi:hypothetical protein
MIRTTTQLLTASLGLMMSAIAVKCADSQTVTAQTAESPSIKISALPFNIVAPGTYVLTSNLTFSASGTAAINISSAIAGPVVLNLKGFTITGSDTNTVVSIGMISPGVSNTYSITIRNGTIQGGEAGVRTYYGSFSDITVHNVVFNQGIAGIEFINVASSTVSNCTFNGSYYGIYDADSNGGNRYNNETFVSNVYPLFVYGANGAIATVLRLDHCQFDAPASNKAKPLP